MEPNLNPPISSTHGEQGPVLPPGVTVPVHDASRDSWAHFKFTIPSYFPDVPTPSYNPGTHRYDDGYVHPRAYDLWLDGGPGMRIARGIDSATSRRGATRASARAASEQMWPTDEGHPLLLPIGGGGAGGRGPGLMPPEDIFAWVWDIQGESGWAHRLISHRHGHEQLQGDPLLYSSNTELPVIGHYTNYTIRLTLVFYDGTYSTQSASFRLLDLLIVSIGDSSASGEGNPDRRGHVDVLEGGKLVCEASLFSREILGGHPSMDLDPVWLEPRAHRSLVNGPSFGAQRLQHLVGDTQEAAGREMAIVTITFLSFARSGAQVVAGLIDSQEQPPTHDFIGEGQIDECARTVGDRPIDALLINIGGNDAGFSGVLEDLLASDNVYTASKDNNPAAVRSRLQALTAVGGQIEDHLDLLKSEVDSKLKPRNVYITTYPIYMFDYSSAPFEDHNLGGFGNDGFRACGIFENSGLLDISVDDYTLILEQGTRLNECITRKATKFGWHLVNPAPDFLGRGYCDGQTLWIGAETSCLRQGDFEGIAHPNEWGHRRWGNHYANAMRTHTLIPALQQRPTHKDPGEKRPRPRRDNRRRLQQRPTHKDPGEVGTDKETKR